MGCGVSGRGEVTDEDEAGDVVTGVEEEVAGVGGEGPVGFAVGGNKHGGELRGGGGLGG